jgi:hypothetical protein
VREGKGMPGKKGTRRVKITERGIQEAREKLALLTEPLNPRTSPRRHSLSMSEAVRQLQPEIDRLIGLGYTLRQIAMQLTEGGTPMTPRMLARRAQAYGGWQGVPALSTAQRKQRKRPTALQVATPETTERAAEEFAETKTPVVVKEPPKVVDPPLPKTLAEIRAAFKDEGKESNYRPGRFTLVPDTDWS